MKRAALLLGLISLMWLAGACSGGSSGNGDPEAEPLSIELLWAEPANGASPLRVVFTANIEGGLAPYYYSWDFTNDGSVDTYINGDFRRTVSVANNYYYRASDPNMSIYNAVLTVTDSVGTQVTSDPVQVSVTGSPVIEVNTDLTGAWSDDTYWDDVAQAEIYRFRSGVPVYFRAAPIGGTPPYTYHWDFDGDGAVDSTQPTPQYVYTNNTDFATLVTYTLEITDANDEKVLWEGLLEMLPPVDVPPPTDGPFDIVLRTTPEIQTNGTPELEDDFITIQFNPVGGGVNLPAEPELDMSVIVSQNGGGGGTPPFEYYWDFENDGSLDSQALSPTIPYYDLERNILINPYLTNKDVANFVLRCIVIDSAGRLESREVKVKVLNTGDLDPIEIVEKYGIIENESYTANPPVAFAEAGGRDKTTDVRFEFDIAESTGVYEFQFDEDGDGNPDVVPGIDFDGDEAGADDEMVAGWYKLHGADRLDFIYTYEGVDYFDTRVTVRSVDSAGNEASGVTYAMPVSLVQVEVWLDETLAEPIVLDEGNLDPRRDHCLTANWTTINGGINGGHLSEREFIIAGGRRGTSVLNKVQRVVQTFDAATKESALESVNFTGASDRPSSNVERYGAVMWTQGPENGPGATIRIHGGANVLTTNTKILHSAEVSTGGGNVGWQAMPEILIPEYYTLMDMAGTWVEDQGMYIMAGGLHQPAEEDNTLYSRKLIGYTPPPVNGYSDLSSMSNGRAECSVAYANGLVYVIGGREASGGTVATVEAYNPATGAWLTNVPQMLEPRSGAVCQVVEGRIYMIGGAYWPPNETYREILDTAEVYNPATETWSYTLPLPTGIYNKNANTMASVVVPAPGGVDGTGTYLNSIVCFGGEGFESATDTSIGEINKLYELTYFHVVPVAAE